MDPLWLLIPAGQRASGEWIDDTLRQRVVEQGLLDRSPEVGRFPRHRVEVVRGDDPWQAANDLYRARGWTDGLPIVPPTLGRVEAMTAATRRPAKHALGTVDPLEGVATVEKIAANAVMAGCLPAHFPVVLAAVEALLEPAFNLRGVQTTDENVAPLLLVGGPAAARLGVNGGYGALGPGWRANATIGRAVRFVMTNIGGGWPGAVSFAGLGQPGRWSLCFAENADASPWPPFHTEHGYAAEASTLTVMRAETAINVTGGLEELASVMGSAASAFALAHDSHVAVIIAPFVARRRAREGWDRAAVRQFLFEHGRVDTAYWKRSWIADEHAALRPWPERVTAAAPSGRIPIVPGPENIAVLVAGADLAIPQCAYFPSWGFPPCRIVKPIEEPAHAA